MNLKLATLFLVGVSCAHGEKNGLRNTARIESVRSASLTSGLVVDFVRMGKGQGSGQMCVDSQKRRFDYGERKLNKDEGRTVNDCAQYCVGNQQEESDLMRHMVGFNFHFEDSLCQCLYKNKELKSTSGFDSLVVKHEGEGKVGGVELKSGWQCYGLEGPLRPFRDQADDNSSGDADEEQTRVGNQIYADLEGPLRPFRDQAEENDSSNDAEEEQTRVGNDIDVDLTVTYGYGGSSSSSSSNSGRGGNDKGELSLCSSDDDCTEADKPYCLRRDCTGVGFCYEEESEGCDTVPPQAPVA